MPPPISTIRARGLFVIPRYRNQWVCPSCLTQSRRLHAEAAKTPNQSTPPPLVGRSQSVKSTVKGKEKDSDNSKWEVTVGLEIHAQLNASRKLFSYAATSFNAPPNSRVAPFDASIPGIQPKLNIPTIVPAIRAAVALDCRINRRSAFDRKHYFYKDQPNGYQITQFYHPFASDGKIVLNELDGLDPSEVVEIGIKQVQMEQDTAKSIFQPSTEDTPARTLVDLNRTGSALVEIITTPSLKSSKHAAACLKKIQSILRASTAAIDGMEKGGVRCDVNVSIQGRGLPGLGRRVEIKNLNSVKAVQESIEAEIKRQIAVRERGGEIEGETRGWDAVKGESRKLRSKEGEVDYRYKPDAELPPLIIDESLVNHIKSTLPPLPDQIILGLMNEPFALTLKDARTMVDLDDGARVNYYRSIYEDLSARQDFKPGSKHLGKLVGNWTLHELGGRLASSFIAWLDNPVTTAQMADLLFNLQNGTLTAGNAKRVLDHLVTFNDSNIRVVDLIEEYDLGSRSTEGEDDEGLIQIANHIISEYPEKAEQVRSGKKPNLKNFFIGNLMKATGGKVDVQACKQVIEKIFSA
ncbi:hypothetical protein AOL_s00083g441 [Orbilia oligospora ATCC 24927]|uniref:Glutamyl-tRNA(Gln) amidotransferase subunit B, mitochondrial n=1 Tax=Arthrobotrys oligospora (strain ATCC 24927 / CBS 115.81 / DSM 1491) TaxID=756982 RepID=G1XHG0_ARTOA|nr:hypothetical protein AOL_s00083g441 [Orbilia oligospora ATCC 24927]EGX47348.1 hypothetical protein AOL_s00083g441 [Orbilia oligospora ATCC 24927]